MAKSSSSKTGRNAASSGVGSSVMFARVGFIAVVACLIIFGLVMLYSASSIYSYNLYGNYTEIFSKQLFFVAVGLFAVLAIALINYQRRGVMWLCVGVLVALCILLILVLFTGNDALGARRWFDLGFTTVQPSEFAKIFMMLVLAYLVDVCRNSGYSLALVVLMIVACAVPLGLIIVEPDLGTTIIAFVGILSVLWLGGVPKRVVALLCGLVLVLGIVAIMGTGFRQARINSWLDPASDPLGDGYQLLNSHYAFGGGGVLGVGLGMSKQKFSWLPQSENDFIFAIVGEELGLIGAFTVALLFVALVYFSLKVARSAPDPLGGMIAGASGIVIGAQAFLNMMCVVGVLPTTGKPLPFFSAGGSSCITTLMLVGLVLTVSLRSHEASVYDFRREEFSVVVGGKKRGTLGESGSVLSRLPNPAAIIAGGIRPSRPAASTRSSSASARSRKAVPEISSSMSRSRKAVPEMHSTQNRAAVSEKIVPISRAQAQKKTREAEALRKKRAGYHTGSGSASGKTEAAPVSMSSLRRNRVRKTGSGGRSA